MPIRRCEWERKNSVGGEEKQEKEGGERREGDSGGEEGRRGREVGERQTERHREPARGKDRKERH
jgi:hypothetical protein